MKTFLTYTAWSVVATVILVAALDPNRGLLLSNPTAALSLGVIGLGLCMEAKQRTAAGRKVRVKVKA